MKKLTSELKDLQRQIIVHTLDQVINADIRYIRDKDGNVTLLFTYHDDEARDQIFALKKEIYEKFNCYFNSSFFTKEPTIEWSLDWSLQIQD